MLCTNCLLDPVRGCVGSINLSIMFNAERKAFLAVLKLPRPTMRETMEFAALYAAQAVVSVLLLKLLFGSLHLRAVIWAIISAILALQPGWSQSVVTSVIRILATTVGASVALAVSMVPVRTELQLVFSLVVVVFVCELLRLDLALRTACVAAVIVLTQGEGHILSTGFDRFFATITGCLMALIIQLITDFVIARIRGKHVPVELLKS